MLINSKIELLKALTFLHTKNLKDKKYGIDYDQALLHVADIMGITQMVENLINEKL